MEQFPFRFFVHVSVSAGLHCFSSHCRCHQGHKTRHILEIQHDSLRLWNADMVRVSTNGVSLSSIKQSFIWDFPLDNQSATCTPLVLPCLSSFPARLFLFMRLHHNLHVPRSVTRGDAVCPVVVTTDDSLPAIGTLNV